MVIHTGGAAGADTWFTMAAVRRGIDVYTHSFLNHHVSNAIVMQTRLIIHSDEELLAQKPYLLEALKLLRRNYPKSSYVERLLLRNFFQVNDSEQVVAAAKVVNPKRTEVLGGTAYAIAYSMMLDIPRYVYCTDKQRWFYGDKCTHGLELTETSPKVADLPTKWSGVGSRFLSLSAARVIADIFS